MAQVAGVWTVTETLNSVSGGDCLGEIVQTTLGRQDTGTLTIAQSGSSLSAISATRNPGSSCSYANGRERRDRTPLDPLRRGDRREHPLRERRASQYPIGREEHQRVRQRRQRLRNDAETWDVFVASTRTEGQGVLVSDSSFAARRQ